MGFFASLQSGKLDRHNQLATRFHFLRHIKLDLQTTRCGIEAKPAQTDGTARHPFGFTVHGPIEARHNIDTRGPIGVHRNRHCHSPLGHVNHLGGNQAVVEHGYHGLASMLRLDLELRRLAGLIGFLIEGDFQHFRAVGIILTPPAGTECNCRRDWSVAALSCYGLTQNFEAIVAGANGEGNIGRCASVNIKRASFDAARIGHAFIAP